jgi:DNA-binding transcriptional LysR family regulator
MPRPFERKVADDYWRASSADQASIEDSVASFLPGNSLIAHGKAKIVTVELYNLRWAIVASQHRSLRQAAETLNIRQSTLSRRLRDLEYQLGVVLFERSNGGIRATTAGQEFLARAQRLIDETDFALARLKARSRGENGPLVIGVHTSFAAGNLRATLVEHMHRFPDGKFTLLMAPASACSVT